MADRSDCHRLINECPEYDLTYLRHAGLRLDLWILWRSLRLVAFGGPMVRVDDIPRFAIRRAVHPHLAVRPHLAVVDPVSLPDDAACPGSELVPSEAVRRPA